MAAQFQDQVSVVLEWFLEWNECEQMVVLCSLLRRISSLEAKFIAQVFEQMFKTSTNPEIEQREQQANDPGFVCSLAKEPKQFAMLQLLKFLPLLKVGNDKAKGEYLQIIPVFMAHCLKSRINIEECRHLLSYLIIHPAFSREELPNLAIWQNGVSELQTGSAKPNLAQTVPESVPSTSVLLASASPAALSTSAGSGWKNFESFPGLDRDSSVLLGSQKSGNFLPDASGSAKYWTLASSCGDSGFSEMEKGSSIGSTPVGRPLRSSSSMPLVEGTYSGALQNASVLTQPYTLLSRAPFDSAYSQGSATRNAPSTVTEWLNRHLQPSSGNKLHLPGNADSLHAPLSPQSSVTSSGSGGSMGGEQHADERKHSQTENVSAMRDVSLWLKSLRLHKYASLFQNISYEEMLNLTEEWLEKQKVTQGARNKILLSIKKLQSRQETLRQLEKDLMVAGNIKHAIEELMQMLRTPIKEYDSSKSLGSKMVTSHTVNQCAVVQRNCDEPNSASEADSIAEGDLPGHMTRLLGKICTQLLVGSRPRPDEECLSAYLQLLDRSLSHQAFTKEQKKKMMSWKQQLYRIFQLHAIQKQNLERHHVSLENVIQAPGAVHMERRALRGQQLLSSVGQPSWSFGPRLSSGIMPTDSIQDPTFPLLQNEPVVKVSVSEGKQPLGRTKSAPIRSPQMGMSCIGTLALAPDGSANDDIHASLDSLCISMTEHALNEHALSGGFGEML